MSARGKMLARCFFVLALAGHSWAGETTPIKTQPKRPLDLNHPPREYVRASAAGWTVWMEHELFEEHAELAGKALARLDKKLAEMRDALPPHARERLGKIEVFLLLGEE